MVPQRGVTHRTARTAAIRHRHCTGFWVAFLKGCRARNGVHDMVLKGFSYAMIGAFVTGLAMTVAGSAGVLFGL